MDARFAAGFPAMAQWYGFRTKRQRWSFEPEDSVSSHVTCELLSVTNKDHRFIKTSEGCCRDTGMPRNVNESVHVFSLLVRLWPSRVLVRKSRSEISCRRRYTRISNLWKVIWFYLLRKNKFNSLFLFSFFSLQGMNFKLFVHSSDRPPNSFELKPETLVADK